MIPRSRNTSKRSLPELNRNALLNLAIWMDLVSKTMCEGIPRLQFWNTISSVAIINAASVLRIDGSPLQTRHALDDKIGGHDDSVVAVLDLWRQADTADCKETKTSIRQCFQVIVNVDNTIGWCHGWRYAEQHGLTTNASASGMIGLLSDSLSRETTTAAFHEIIMTLELALVFYGHACVLLLDQPKICQDPTSPITNALSMSRWFER